MGGPKGGELPISRFVLLPLWPHVLLFVFPSLGVFS